MEECLSREQLLEELKGSIRQLSEEHRPFEFDDLRQKRTKGTQDTETDPVTATSAKRDASVPPGQGVSISEAVGKYFGSLPKNPSLTAEDNPLLDSNMFEQQSQAPKPLVRTERRRGRRSSRLGCRV